MEKHLDVLRVAGSNNDCRKQLGRAFSFSELPTTTRRVRLEQHYQSVASAGLIRQYSCEEIFDSVTKTRQVKVSAEVVKAGSGNGWKEETWLGGKNGARWPERSDNFAESQRVLCNKKEVEYMEVDDIEVSDPPILNSPSSESGSGSSASNSTTMLFNSHARNSTECSNHDTSLAPNSAKQASKVDYQALKKKLRPLLPSESSTRMTYVEESKFSWSKIIFFLLLPIALLAAGVVTNPEYFGLFSPCNGNQTFCNAREELREQLYGQSKAILALSSLLVNNKSQMKIICLVGGTGVGKTFTVEIIKRNFPLQENIFLYSSPLHQDQQYLDINSLSSLTCNLVVIENLKGKLTDVTRTADFLSPLSHLKDYCVTVLAIFNLDYTDNNLKRQMNLPESTEHINKSFQQYQLQPVLVEFEPLSEAALEQCISDAAKVTRLMLSPQQISRLKKMLISANAGCKGAYSKVQIVGRE